MDLLLKDEHRQVREMARKFADEVVAPRARGAPTSSANLRAISRTWRCSSFRNNSIAGGAPWLRLMS